MSTIGSSIVACYRKNVSHKMTLKIVTYNFSHLECLSCMPIIENACIYIFSFNDVHVL